MSDPTRSSRPGDFADERNSMVTRQLEERGIKDPRVLQAIRIVPRHLFVPRAYRSQAYADGPLPISEGQTISQPYMVAWMTELLELKGTEKVLEVGTGSGYQAAVLGVLARDVYTIERHHELVVEARKRLETLGCSNVTLVEGDGTRGYPEAAPYNGILVTAGSPSIPDPLLEQLADGGRLVVPVGSSGMQTLIVAERDGDRIRTHEKGTCVFVPLVGRFGWRS